MQENDNIAAFSSNLRDISNKEFQLGEKYSEEKLVRKTLRSLPMRFNEKIASIEEAKDMTKMTFKDLLGSLQTYEMNLNAQSKDKGIALKAEVSTQNNSLY